MTRKMRSNPRYIGMSSHTGTGRMRDGRLMLTKRSCEQPVDAAVADVPHIGRSPKLTRASRVQTTYSPLAVKLAEVSRPPFDS